MNPMNEITRRLPFFTPLRLKLPSIPVTVPLVVPFTTIEAPMSGSPLVSTTTPLHKDGCCCIVKPFEEASAPDILGLAG